MSTAPNPPEKPSRTVAESEAAHLGVVRQVRMMVRAIFSSPVGKALVAIMVSIVVILVATAYGQIRLNSWNKPFYDALSRRDLREFLYQLGVFFLIAGGLLALDVVQTWLVQTMELKLREGLVRSLLKEWLRPRRAFWLANAGTMGVNPDQRIHEDA